MIWHDVHMALRARLEAIAEIPPEADRAWSNVDFTPPLDRPYIESLFRPGAGGAPRLISNPAANGVVESRGSYIVRYFGLTHRGEQEISDVVQAICDAFPPMKQILLPDGTHLYIRGDQAPVPSEILPAGRNKSMCAVTILFFVHSFNSLS